MIKGISTKLAARLNISLVILLAANLLASFGVAEAAQTTGQFFPETGHTVSGKFLEYWQANGGLPVYGYPITEAQSELDPETGKFFLTQWFERNRFELHPENAGTKYEVLLGLLGKDLQRDALAIIDDFRPAQPKPTARFFTETSHNLEGAFLSYWLDNGGLERFGYPISEARSEGNLETDKILWTQWFERARFEFHPSNKPPYNVLLGLLGKQIKNQPPVKGGQISPVWQKSATDNLFSGFIQGIDAQNNIYAINPAWNMTGYPTEYSILQRYSPTGQLTLTIVPAIVGKEEFYLKKASVAKQSGFIALGVLKRRVQYESLETQIQLYDAKGTLLSQWWLDKNTDADKIAVDDNGNVYIQSYKVVKKFNRQGQFLTNLIEYARNDDNNDVDDLAVDSQNNVYLAVREDRRKEKEKTTIKRFDSQGKLQAQWVVAIPEVATEHYKLQGVDSSGNLVLSWTSIKYPQDSSFVAKFAPDGNFLSKWDLLNLIPEATQETVSGVVVDSEGNLFLSLAGQPFIVKIDKTGKYVGRLLEPEQDKFKCVTNIVWLKDNLYALDKSLNRLFQLDINGQYIAQVKLPQGLGLKLQGVYLNGLYTNGLNLYFWLDDKLYRYNSVGQPSGQLEVKRGGDGNTGLIIDSAENITVQSFVMKSGLHVSGLPMAFVLMSNMVADSEGTLYTVAKPGEQGSVMENNLHAYKFKPGQSNFLQWGKYGTADGEFSNAETYLSIDSQDNIYILDKYMGRLQKFDKSGKLLAKWNNSNLKFIDKFAVDDAGNFYAAKGCSIVKIALQ